MAQAMLVSVIAAFVFAALAWVTVLAARPATRLLQSAVGTRRIARRVSTGRDWVTQRIAVQLLVLASGCALVLGLALAFFEVTDDVVEHDDLAALDQPVLLWLSEHRSGTLTRVEIAITNLGGGVALTAMVTVAAVAVSLKLRSWRPVILAAIAGGGIQLLVFGIKLLIGRARPDQTGRLVDVTGYSFPSGHSAGAFVCFGMLAWLVSMAIEQASIRATAWLTAALLTIAVGLSRAYLAVHYPSDIIGGWILGLTWLLTVALAAFLTKGSWCRSTISGGRWFRG